MKPPTTQMSPAGVELFENSSEKNASDPERAANLRAAAAPDRDLAAVVNAWPSLSEAVRAGILTMVRAAGGAG
jgi:hypothetical protein